jgi:hypothetical protein
LLLALLALGCVAVLDGELLIENDLGRFLALADVALELERLLEREPVRRRISALHRREHKEELIDPAIFLAVGAELRAVVAGRVPPLAPRLRARLERGRDPVGYGLV